MLDDGLEFKKEIRTINISLVQGFFSPFFLSLPPFPLSGSVDPLKTHPNLTKDNKQPKRRKVDPRGVMFWHRQHAAKICVPQCISHFSATALSGLTTQRAYVVLSAFLSMCKGRRILGPWCETLEY